MGSGIIENKYGIIFLDIFNLGVRFFIGILYFFMNIDEDY